MITVIDGRSDRAIEAFEKVVALTPNLPQGWLYLAINCEAEARYAEALEAYEQVLVLQPDNALARNLYDKLTRHTPH